MDAVSVAAVRVKQNGRNSSTGGTYNVCFVVVADHQTFTCNRSGAFHGMVKNFRCRFVFPDVFRTYNHVKVMQNTAVLKFDVLNFFEPIGNDVKFKILFEFGEYFLCSRKQLSLIGRCSDIQFRYFFCKSAVVDLKTFQSVVKALYTQYILCYFSLTVTVPELAIDFFIRGIKRLERAHALVQIELCIYMIQGNFRICFEIPKRVI